MEIHDNIQDSEIRDPETPHEHPHRHAVLLWLVIVALLAVAGLYVLHFTQTCRNEAADTLLPALTYHQEGGLKVAYVDSDSLKAHYQLVHDLQKKLEDKYAQLNQDISTRQSKLEERANDLQQRYESKLISLTEAQKIDEQLKAEGQKLYDLNQQYSEKMADEELRLNQIYVDSINLFLERMNLKYHFDYILGYSRGGGILLAKDTLNITPMVVEGLNSEYFKRYPDSKKKTK